MTHKQVILAALILGLCAAGTVWWLERYNRDLLQAQMKAWLDSIPTYQKPEGPHAA